MRGCKKFFFMMISILLCSVLITSTAISGTLAKYARNDSGTTTASVAKWGVTVTPGTDVDAYEDGDTIYISSETGVIAPGTSGYLASFEVIGSPEVAVKLDFSGDLTIGDGFLLSANRKADENKNLPIYIRDEIGRIIEYFPIAIYMYRYDYNPDGTLKGTAKQIKRACVVRLTPDAPAEMTYLVKEDDDDSWDGLYRMSFFTGTRHATLLGLEEAYRGSSGYIATAFDQDIAVSTPIKSTYVVRWEWPYSNEYKVTSYNDTTRKKDRGNGTIYHYQTKELDTQLGELIAQYPDLFNITLDMSLTVSQID